MPRVFADAPPSDSGVWGRQVELHRGQVCLVDAASGRGKSSLCAYIYGYRQDYEGVISFDGDTSGGGGVKRDIRTLSRGEWSSIRRSGLAIMMQDLRLFPELSARENVELKNRLTHGLTAAQIDEMFERLGIADKADAKVAHLSLGQQQRVAFVRTLCQSAGFVLLDEPVSHLDDVNAAAMAAILSEWAARQGAGVVVTSIGRHLPMEYDKIIEL